MRDEDARTVLAPVGVEPVTTALAETVAPVDPVDLGTAPGVARAARSDGAVSGSGGDTPGRYVEQGLLGKGGLGEVVEAFDRDLRRTVALKRPLADRMSPQVVARLVREAQVTAQLEHPGIVAVHTLGIDEAGRPFFTMTRLGGESLAALLARRRTEQTIRNQLTLARLLRIFAQVAYAVAFAHERGVIHRDIKPENILIGEFGEVRLVDWGIAKVICDADDHQRDEGGQDRLDRERASLSKGDQRAREEGASHATHTSVDTTASVPRTRAGSFTGTPGYAAPEQAAGRTDLDQRADIYALGAVLYEMLSGRPPVVGETLAEMVDATLEGRIQPLDELTTVPAPLAAIVHKALSLESAERFDSALDMVADLEAALEGRPVSALQECKISRARRWYMARSPRWARFRTVDVDSLMWGSVFLGFGLAGLVAALASEGWLRPWWLWVGAGLLVLAIPAYTALRKERPDDPGGVLAFSEGVVSRTGTGRHMTHDSGSRSRGLRRRVEQSQEIAPTQAAEMDPGGSGDLDG